MRARSCFIRYLRYVLQCGICSLLTFFINSDRLINEFRLQVVSTVLFMLVLAIDSYVFESYFGKKKHFKFGIVYPYAMFAVTSYILHFAIRSVRWNYLFLPYDILECFGFERIYSLTIVHIITIAVISVCAKLGKSKFYKNN